MPYEGLATSQGCTHPLTQSQFGSTAAIENSISPFAFLTSNLCGALGCEYGGRRGGQSQGCPGRTKEVGAGTLLVLPALVLVQPLRENLDHGVLFQDLSVESADPERQNGGT